MSDSEQIKKLARAVLSTEAEAIQALLPRVDDTFVSACKLLLDCRGRIVDGARDDLPGDPAPVALAA